MTLSARTWWKTVAVSLVPLAPATVFAQAGQALATDGTNYAEVADNPGLSATGALTVSAWFRYGTFVAPAGRVLSKAWSNQQAPIAPYISYGFVVDEQTRTPAGPHTVAFSVGGANGEAAKAVAKTSLIAGQWVHVAGVFDPTFKKLRMYLNGALDDEVDVPFSALADTNGSFRVGSDQQMEGFNQAVNGTIDEVTLWSRALTEAEIADVMNRPPSSAQPGLIASWLFEDAAGSSSVTDASGNGNHASLVKTPLLVDTGVPARYPVSESGGAGGGDVGGTSSGGAFVGFNPPSPNAAGGSPNAAASPASDDGGGCSLPARPGGLGAAAWLLLALKTVQRLRHRNQR